MFYFSSTFIAIETAEHAVSIGVSIWSWKILFLTINRLPVFLIDMFFFIEDGFAMFMADGSYEGKPWNIVNNKFL